MADKTSPLMSASTSTTLRPWRARLRATLSETVVLPQPPLGLATVTTRPLGPPAAPDRGAGARVGAAEARAGGGDADGDARSACWAPAGAAGGAAVGAGSATLVLAALCGLAGRGAGAVRRSSVTPARTGSGGGAMGDDACRPGGGATPACVGRSSSP